MGDMMRLSVVSKKMAATFKDKEMDQVGVLNSFHLMLTKTGFTGLRNNNLKKIDMKLLNMHFQAEGLKRACWDL